MKKVNVGLVGFGTIGGGVADILIKMREEFQKRLGFDLHLTKIADKDIITDRGIELKDTELTTDYKEIINDPSIDIVVELVGGYGFAKQLVLEAIEAGKHVVTANKALIAVYGEEIFSKAKEKKVDIYYEASVGGGIPIIKAVKEEMLANNIEKIYAIINGTCNYILTEMEEKNLDFDIALKNAQAKGFAEADPTFDIDGIDSAHKLAILGSLAFWSEFKYGSFLVEGIRNISQLDIQYAKELGYTIKLLAIGVNRENNYVELRVHPTMIPKYSTLAVIKGEFNAVMLEGNNVGELLFKGKGAGRYPTASAVVSDIIDIARNIIYNSINRVPVDHKLYKKDLLPKEEIESEYYLRLKTVDKAGVLAKITSVFKDYNISIKSILQKDTTTNGEAIVIILTHLAKEGQIEKLIEDLNKLDVVLDNVQLIRVLNL